MLLRTMGYYICFYSRYKITIDWIAEHAHFKNVCHGSSKANFFDFLDVKVYLFPCLSVLTCVLGAVPTTYALVEK